MTDDDDDWVDRHTLRKVQNAVRKGRAALDVLERNHRHDVAAGLDDTWVGLARAARLTGRRAEFQYWTELLARLNRRGRRTS
jgi:hypothetical protein